MKLTKYCLLPWTFMQVHAGGMMQCCAVAPDTDIGDFILDYCEKGDEECDPFNNEGLQAIRKGILSGNLRPMCRNCFYVPNELITTIELERRLKDFLQPRLPEIDLENTDLTKVHAYSWMAISFTNRCNLSCIYCVQSVHKDTNPYFKMEFPYEYAEKTLDLFAAQGIERLSTCVEGEATLYRHWYDIFSKFHEKYPHVKMRMTTNLNRKFSEKELELLVAYRVLDISIDSLNPQLYAQMRRGGKLELVLENLDLIVEKAKKMGVTPPYITLHSVVSDATWSSMESLAEYAFERGFGVELGDYEERANTIAVQEKRIKPVSQLPFEEQRKVCEMIERIKEQGKLRGCHVGIQGEIFSRVKANVDENYNEFQPYDDNPIINAFYNEYPKGLPEAYLYIVYDVDNISHEGIMLGKGYTLNLSRLDAVKSVVVREIHIYKNGTVSARYGQNVMLRYRKRITVENGLFSYMPQYPNENVENVLLEICDYE